MNSTRTPRSGITIDPFDGDQTKYRTFLRQLQLLYLVEEETYNTPARKIQRALASMTGGFAEEWANARTDEFIATGNFGSWSGFQDLMDRTFQTSNLRDEAFAKLRALKQRKLAAREFFTQFDYLAGLAGLNEAQHGHVLIDMLKVSINFDLLDRLYTADALPTTYTGWKEKTIRLDDLRIQRREIGNYARPPLMYAPRPTTTPAPSAPRTTAPADPNAMAIDRQKTPVTCYNCRKTGHISRNCPQPATSDTLARRAAAPNRFRNVTILPRGVPANDEELIEPTPVDAASLEEEIAKLKDTMELLRKENDSLRQDFCTGKE